MLLIFKSTCLGLTLIRESTRLIMLFYLLRLAQLLIYRCVALTPTRLCALEDSRPIAWDSTSRKFSVKHRLKFVSFIQNFIYRHRASPTEASCSGLNDILGCYFRAFQHQSLFYKPLQGGEQLDLLICLSKIWWNKLSHIKSWREYSACLTAVGFLLVRV